MKEIIATSIFFLSFMLMFDVVFSAFLARSFFSRTQFRVVAVSFMHTVISYSLHSLRAVRKSVPTISNTQNNSKQLW